jgi:hypothetical protein
MENLKETENFIIQKMINSSEFPTKEILKKESNREKEHSLLKLGQNMREALKTTSTMDLEFTPI